MQSTMTLLANALDKHPPQYWHDRLKLNRNALHNARMRGHISPAIAGALAEELGENPSEWIVIAALESERDSACKSRMLDRLKTSIRNLYFSTAQHVAQAYRKGRARQA